MSNAPLGFPFGFFVNDNTPIDGKYFNKTTLLPYTSVAEANTEIPQSLRYKGLTVNVDGVEYWYADGINLIVKNASGVDKVGDLATLQTNARQNAVAAINELKALLSTLTVSSTGNYTAADFYFISNQSNQEVTELKTFTLTFYTVSNINYVKIATTSGYQVPNILNVDITWANNPNTGQATTASLVIPANGTESYGMVVQPYMSGFGISNAYWSTGTTPRISYSVGENNLRITHKYFPVVYIGVEYNGVGNLNRSVTLQIRDNTNTLIPGYQFTIAQGSRQFLFADNSLAFLTANNQTIFILNQTGSGKKIVEHVDMYRQTTQTTVRTNITRTDIVGANGVYVSLDSLQLNDGALLTTGRYFTANTTTGVISLPPLEVDEIVLIQKY